MNYRQRTGRYLTQAQHARINESEWPGTREICAECGQATERCEEDTIYRNDDHEALCVSCKDKEDAKEEADHLKALGGSHDDEDKVS